MNAYDFDDTIYDGESVIDFFFFVLKKDYRLLRYTPYIIVFLIKYKFNKISVEEITSAIDRLALPFFKNKHYDYEALVEDFWEKNIHKLKPEFLKKLKKDDLIITGSPNFLINHIKDKLNVGNIICTQFNLETKKLEFLCFGKNKVKIFKEIYKDTKINEFYTDSLADIPFMQISDKVYFVNKNEIKLIDKDKYIKQLKND